MVAPSTDKRRLYESKLMVPVSILRLRLGVGPGVRGGQLRVAGEAAVPSTTEDSQQALAFGGPMVAAHVEWLPSRHWALQFQPEVGTAVWGADAIADGRRIVDLRDVWGRLQLTLTWRP